MASNFSFRIDISDYEKKWLKFQDRFWNGLEAFAETGAKKLEASAKENKPWEDRSGRAKQSLTGTVEKIPKCYRLILAHGVDYGIFLELCHDKNYAIIMPTIQKEGPEIMKELNNLFDHLT